MTRVPRDEATGDDRRIRDDLAALERRSRARLRPLDTAVGAARERGRAKGAIVIGSKTLGARWAAIPLAAAAVLVLLLVPFSREAVTGHDFTLTVSGPAGTQALAGPLARELGLSLGGVTPGVGSSASADGASVSFTAFVPLGAGVNPAAVGEAFAAALRDRGYHAAARAEERREQVSGTLYAMARDTLIEVDASGKTDAEVAAEIVSRLAAAGLPGATATVVREGDQTLMDIVIPEGGPGRTTVVLTSDEAGFVEDFRRESVRERHDGDTLILEVSGPAGPAVARVDHPGDLTDQELADAVLRQFTAQGVSVSVSVQDGQVTLIPTDKLQEATGNASWSEVKKRGNPR